MSVRTYLARLLGLHPLRPHAVSPQAVKAALASLGAFQPPPGAEAANGPIFVFATGWRCGSTLLQRILMTDRRLLLWGEPMGRAGILPNIAEGLAGATPGWPPPHYFIGARTAAEPLHQDWIANLFPNSSDLRAALRALVERWLVAPAHAAGFARWGMKEVRFGAAEAYLLRWLFPDARFVVLTRDPCAAFHSIRRSAPNWLYMERWPDRRVDTPHAFAEVWNRLALSWADVAADLRPAHLRYEDIVAGTVDYVALARELGLEIEPGLALAARVGASPEGAPLTPAEREIVMACTAAGRRSIGY